MGGINNDVIDPLGGKFYMIQLTLTAAAGASVSTLPAEPIGAQPFRWEELGAFWDDAKGIWTIKVTDNGNDEAFSSGKISVDAVIGSADRDPYILKHPYLFTGGSSIMVEATNDGSAQDTLTLVFIGKRLPKQVK